MSGLTIEDWGRTAYQAALEKQLSHVGEVRGGNRGPTLVFTEHHPVYTIGRRKDANRNLIATTEFLESRGIEVVKTNRGGDITYHGPGQIVGYLFIDLSVHRDLHDLLRRVEQGLIGTLSELGLHSGTREGKTGVWVEDRKIAAIGMGARQWVSFHGFALNVTTDLSYFSGIIPCGISDGSVTSLENEMESLPPIGKIKQILAERFEVQLGSYLYGSSNTETPSLA